jgi:hypothetical protein
MSPKMTEFLSKLPGPSREAFQARIDSEDDDFIDEYLANCPNGYWVDYVKQSQSQRRHRQVVTPHPLIWWSFGVSIVAIVLTFLAWWFPREPQAIGHKEPVRQIDTPALLPPSLPPVVLPATNALISTTTNQVRP